MSIVTNTWRQLVRRRLWPVALLLLGALAAVPLLLARDPEPTPAPATAPAAKAETAAAGDPVVALATAEDARRRRVLGASKDPFEPAPVKPVKAAEQPAGSEVPDPEPVTVPEGGNLGSGGSTLPVGSMPSPVAPAPSEPEAKKPTYPLYTLTVRFGASESDAGPRRHVKRLEALPSADEPVLVYLGVEDGGKEAVFMVDTDVVAQGDGTCKPDPQTCETLHLREGDTEFFDVVDEEGNVSGQYQLDLVDIQTKKTASAAAARKAYAKASNSGRRVVRAHTATRGPLRYSYDVRRGVVKRLGKKAFKAAVTGTAVGMAGGFATDR